MADDNEAILDYIMEATAEELNTLAEAIHDRRLILRRQVATKVRRSIQVGSRVQITAGKPAYLNGALGTVTEIRQTRCTVKLDAGPVGKFRSGTVITPFQLLKPLD